MLMAEMYCSTATLPIFALLQRGWKNEARDGRCTRGKSLREGGDRAEMVHCEHRETMANMLRRRGREQVSAKNSMNKFVRSSRGSYWFEVRVWVPLGCTLTAKPYIAKHEAPFFFQGIPKNAPNAFNNPVMHNYVHLKYKMHHNVQ